MRDAYAARDPLTAAGVHANFANHLRAAGADVNARVAHRLASAVLYRVFGNVEQSTWILQSVAAEPRRQGLRSTLPRHLSDIATTVNQVPGVDLMGLLATSNLHPETINDHAESIVAAARKNR